MTRKEIARAFKDAQETINELAVFSGNCPPKHQPFADRAAQVENMRCETCEYRPSLTCENERSVGFRNLVEYDNGCFHHKPRVTG